MDSGTSDSLEVRRFHIKPLILAAARNKQNEIQCSIPAVNTPLGFRVIPPGISKSSAGHALLGPDLFYLWFALVAKNTPYLIYSRDAENIMPVKPGARRT